MPATTRPNPLLNPSDSSRRAPDRSPGRFVGLLVLVFLLVGTPLLLTAEPVRGQLIFDTLQQGRDYRTGISLLRKGEYELARKQFEDFLATYPESNYRSRSYFGLAETFYLQNQYDTAAGHYLRSLTRGETLPLDLRMSAYERGLESARRSGRHEVGRRILDQLKQDPARPRPDRVDREAIEFLDSTGHRDAAIDWARKLRKRSNNADTWTYELALLHSRAKNYDQAVSLLKEIKATGPYQVPARYLLAEIYYAQDSLVQAESYYESLLESSTHHRDGLYGLAWVAIKRGNLSRAREQLKKLTQSEGVLRGRAARDLARLARQQNKPEEAVDWYTRSIEWSTEPLKSRVRLELADYYVKRDQLRKAIPHYEAARALGLENEKRLIRGYILKGEYREAYRIIRSHQDRGNLLGPRWEYYRALALYHQNQPDSALNILPSAEAAPDTGVRTGIWRLRARIAYDRKQWHKARNFYRRWAKEVDDPEPRYYLGLLAERQNRLDRAREYWSSLLRENPPEPWASRCAYQMARLAFQADNLNVFDRYQSEINPEVLSPSLRTEWDLIRMAHALRAEGATPETRERAITMLDRSRRHGLQAVWFRRMINEDLPRSWWSEILLPVLLEDTVVRRNAAGEALATLRQNNRASFSLGVGRRLLERSLSPPVNRRVRLQQMETLHALGRDGDIGQYLPDREHWPRWARHHARRLGLNLARYHRARGTPREGLEALQELNDLRPRDNRLARLFQEWIAAFEIDLGRYKSAAQRLSRHTSDLTRSGRLNLAIAEFYRGKTESSLKRIRRLKSGWQNPPYELFDYGFRVLKQLRKTETLIDWSKDFVNTETFSDTQIVSLQLKNAQYWIQNKHIPHALETLRRLTKRSVSKDRKIPLVYYQAVAEFNRGNLNRSLEILDRVESEFELSQDWKYRLYRMRAEVHLRAENWTAAYRTWQELDEMKLGGEVGLRMLSGQAVEESPQKFRNVLKQLETQYSKKLPESERHFWWGRLFESQDRPRDAIRRYQNYLKSGAEERRTGVRQRLAHLYEQIGNHEAALQQYRSLLESTEDPRYRVLIAGQLQELDRVDEARQQLQAALEEWPERRGWIYYKISQLHLSQDETDAAFRTLRRALDNGPDTADWVGGAREDLLTLALNRNDLDVSQAQLNRMDTGPLRDLYEIEMLRRKGHHDEALRKLDRYRAIHDTTTYRDRFLTIATAVYKQAGAHREIVRVLPDRPDDPDLQLQLLRSLLELERTEPATRLYHNISLEVLPRAAVLMGDYHYERGEWRPALGYYRESETTPQIRFRTGRILQKLGNPQQAYRVWSSLLSDLSKSSQRKRWVGPLLAGLARVTEQRQSWGPSATLLDKNWSVVRTRADTAARLGLQWSLRSEDPGLIRAFMKRMSDVPEPLFLETARTLQKQQRYDLLATWVEQTRVESHSPSLAHRFYDLLADVHTRPDTTVVARAEDALDSAVQSSSPYGPRLQKLLGDYYFQQGKYQEAAIQYHRVEILFEKNDQLVPARLGLARSYARMGKTKRARELYNKLADNSSHPDIQKEAKEWLDKHSSDSS